MAMWWMHIKKEDQAQVAWRKQASVGPNLKQAVRERDAYSLFPPMLLEVPQEEESLRWAKGYWLTRDWGES